MGDIRPDIMADLIHDKVFLPTRMFNYQAICQNPAPKILTALERLMLKKERTGAKSSASTLLRVSIYFYYTECLLSTSTNFKGLRFDQFQAKKFVCTWIGNDLILEFCGITNT